MQKPSEQEKKDVERCTREMAAILEKYDLPIGMGSMVGLLSVGITHKSAVSINDAFGSTILALSQNILLAKMRKSDEVEQ